MRNNRFCGGLGGWQRTKLNGLKSPFLIYLGGSLTPRAIDGMKGMRGGGDGVAYDSDCSSSNIDEQFLLGHYVFLLT